MTSRPRRWRTTWIVLVVVYLLLLVASFAVRASRPPGPVPADEESASVRPQVGAGRRDGDVRIAWRDLGPRDASSVVVLLHGSPGDGRQVVAVGKRLATDRRVLIPDLPGFGASQLDVPDYSIRAHAGYTLQLLDHLGIGQVDVVGFSLGGAVAVEMVDRAPERVRSLTLLSATGVQELELLGDYHLNHLVHGVQLAGMWALQELVPHFGALDGSFFGVEYARNFYDTDQRPLRSVLERIEVPVLILHGEHDPLVPVQAAIEHHRIVPQSELVLLDSDHFMPFREPGRIATPIAAFLDRVDAGTAVTRAEADPARLAAAARPFDPASVPPAEGLTLLVMMAGIAAATLVSEDLTCIGTGLLVAQGRIGFVAGVVACLAGIFVGDVLLFLLGRILGRPVVRRAPLRWFLSEERLDRASLWFRKRGPVVVAVSRFLPGARLPTYVAAGVLRTSFLAFCLWFLVAAGAWTPILVGLSAGAAAGGRMAFGASSAGARWIALIAAVGLFVAIRIGIRLATHRGRRRLVGTWRRWTRWEFWPRWLFYPPVVIAILWMGLRHRGLTTFSAANPAMPAGGFVGESKAEILAALAAAGAPVARFRLLRAADAADARVAQARAFLAEERLDFPVVLKPDAGERGRGVEVVHDTAGLEAYLASANRDVLIQERVPGVEFGVFYYRRPGDERGAIFSITEKRMPVVRGDGRRTLEQLILDDSRAVALASIYARANADRLGRVPEEGEAVRLVEIGTHCRGAIFLDGGRIRTPQLEAAVDGMSRGYAGFFFGRYDLRAPSEEAFRAGERIKILELNGVTSESTDIYDPKNRLRDAYGILIRQWRLAFEIGAANRARGARPASVREIFQFLTGES